MPEESYALQFLWIDLSSDFDVIGPYFTCLATMEMRFLHSIVTRTMLAFTRFGFGVRAVLCNGCSSNLALLKLLCGHSNAEERIAPYGSNHLLMERKSLQLSVLHIRYGRTDVHVQKHTQNTY